MQKVKSESLAIREVLEIPFLVRFAANVGALCKQTMFNLKLVFVALESQSLFSKEIVVIPAERFCKSLPFTALSFLQSPSSGTGDKAEFKKGRS